MLSAPVSFGGVLHQVSYFLEWLVMAGGEITEKLTHLFPSLSVWLLSFEPLTKQKSFLSREHEIRSILTDFLVLALSLML